MPNLYIIAGPNGAGKTTFARKFLPLYANCEEFVNADLIAAGLSPFAPESVAIQAGRLMLERVRSLAARRVDFAFETTLSGKTYVRLLRELKAEGYQTHLAFLWLRNVELSVARVARRVQQGGHHIPEDVIRRRFNLGLRNLFQSYRPVLDRWWLYLNTGEEPQLIVEEHFGEFRIIEASLYQEVLKVVEGNEDVIN